jgi:hypothetical protein
MSLGLRVRSEGYRKLFGMFLGGNRMALTHYFIVTVPRRG